MPLHVSVHHATMTIEAPTMTGQLPPTTAGNKSTGLLPPATSGFLRMRYTVGAETINFFRCQFGRQFFFPITLWTEREEKQREREKEMGGSRETAR
jgi:hypothetical protein